MKRHQNRRTGRSHRRLVMETLESRRLLAGIPMDGQFDFGTRTSAVEPGFARVSESSAYNQSEGYGWLSGAVRSADRRAGSRLDRDFNFTPNGVFAVDVRRSFLRSRLL